MGSRTIMADRTLKDIDAAAIDVITGNPAALDDGTTYFLQNTAIGEGGAWEIGQHHYACLVRTASQLAANVMGRALRGAQRLYPEADPIEYTPKAGETGYIWSPFGPVFVSIVEKD